MADRSAVPSGPLSDLRVIEGATFVAVPSGAMTLAMLGAEVIRFDPIGGASDYRRAPLAAGGASLYWASLNKGKRSVALDVRRPRGRELARAMITSPDANAGIFVTNALAGPELSYDALRSERDDLIMVQLSGYDDGRPAVDYTVNAEVGFPTITGAADGPPAIHSLPAWDLLAGLHVALSVVTAERRRRLVGSGAHVTISLADVALAATDQLGYFAEVQVNGRNRERSGEYVYGTFGAPFETRDDSRVMVVALTSRQWSDLVQLTDTHGVLDALEEHFDTDFADEHHRYRHRELLHTVLAPWFKARERAEVLEEVARTRVLVAPFQSFDECLASVQVQDSTMFSPVHHPVFGELLAAGIPGSLGASGNVAPVAPMLGADTEWALTTLLGLSALEIGELVDQGVVACGSTEEGIS